MFFCVAQIYPQKAGKLKAFSQIQEPYDQKSDWKPDMSVDASVCEDDGYMRLEA